ncbi:MAG: S-adenosylmethionine decarboxylase [Actinomycetota bacterium]|nr:S-adenosylmethionine decarboxylase [Actinomycetota bacterium]
MLDNDSRSDVLRTFPDPHLAPARTAGEAPSMRLWAMDAWVRNARVLTDLERLRTIMYDAAEAGDVTVLGEEFCVFDNGAVTGVLVLAQSHLSIHTWPEFALANIDLLSYGNLCGADVMRWIGEWIDAERVNVACVVRGLP